MTSPQKPSAPTNPEGWEGEFDKTFDMADAVWNVHAKSFIRSLLAKERARADAKARKDQTLAVQADLNALFGTTGDVTMEEIPGPARVLSGSEKPTP